MSCQARHRPISTSCAGSKTSSAHRLSSPGEWRVRLGYAAPERLAERSARDLGIATPSSKSCRRDAIDLFSLTLAGGSRRRLMCVNFGPAT